MCRVQVWRSSGLWSEIDATVSNTASGAIFLLLQQLDECRVARFSVTKLEHMETPEPETVAGGYREQCTDHR
ncbi:hypothetical protein A2U01_0057049, partial [Trifolium medium]|nr:hypothetical protein [Trifolium medium]